MEVAYTMILNKIYINRGFLYGPFLPIYGLGAILITLLLNSEANIFFIFLVSLISTTLLEYFGSFALEKIFSLKWWDYSAHTFNLNGRICLRNSLLFGLLGVVVIKVLNPIVDIYLLQFNEMMVFLIIMKILIVYFLIDLIVTTIKIRKFDLEKLEQVVSLKLYQIHSEAEKVAKRIQENVLKENFLNFTDKKNSLKNKLKNIL